MGVHAFLAGRGLRRRFLWFIRICILIAAVFAPLANPQTPAQAAFGSLTLSSIQGEANVSSTTLTLSGSGFTGSTITGSTNAVYISVRNSLNTGPSYKVLPSSGNFSLQITIPVNQTPDRWTITATQDGFLGTVSGFTFYYAFGWSVSPAQAPANGVVQFSGNHFPPNHTVSAYISGLLFFSANTGSAGSFTVSAPVPLNAGVSKTSIFLYDTTSGQFTYLSSKQFAVQTDLTIAHLEYTQVIQRWDNSIPLVSGKPTVVRVYVQANGPAGASGTVLVDSAAMDVYHGTTYLGSISPTNPSIRVQSTPVDPQSLRNTVNATFNFLIPSSWTFADGIKTCIFLNTTGDTPETNYGNDSTCVTLFFVQTYPLYIYGLMYADPNYPYPAVPYSDYTSHINFVRQTWPVPGVYLYQPANPKLYYGTVNGTDANNPYFPGGATVAADADKLRQQASYPYNGYYWYVLQPWDTCICGLAYFPPARGATGQDNRDSRVTGAVMAQEIGHNFGQLHTGHVGPNNYPDPNCCPDGMIITGTEDTAFGFNTSTMQVIPPGTLNGTHAHDFMSYGGPPIWVSDYTYLRLLNKLRYIADQPAPPSKLPLTTTQQSYIYVSGTISDTTGTLNPTYVLTQPVGTDDLPGTGPYALELRNGSNQVLFTRYFDLEETHHPESGIPGFNQVIPYDPRTQSLVLREGNQILATLNRSAHAPSVTIIKPQAGAHWNGARQVVWQGSDADGDKLAYAVHYSTDNGQTWLPLAVDVLTDTLNIDANFLSGSRNCLVRVIASDGLNTSIAVSGVFGVDPHMPSVTITSNPQTMENRQVILNGDGFDADDGPLPEQNLVWSSDRDGVLGSGRTLVTTQLSLGHHTITLTGTDADHNQVTAKVQVQIGNAFFVPLASSHSLPGW